MDETVDFLEMGFNTTIDFRGNKNIEIDMNGREYYRPIVMLSAAVDCSKLQHLIILKGEPGKTVETKLINLHMLKIIICIYTAKKIHGVINLYLENRLNIFLNLMKNV